MESKTTESTTVDTVKAEQVLIIPGYLFFVETIEVPNELEFSEIQDFAELSLESIAPLPINQLLWGYLYRAGTPTLLLYAAYNEKIKNDGFTELDNYAWVIPDFAALSNARFSDDTLVLLEGENSVSMAYFESGAEIPKYVWVDKLTEPITDNVINTLKSKILNLPEAPPVLNLCPTNVILKEDGTPIFEHMVSRQSEDEAYRSSWQALNPTESQLWQMDVRSNTFKTAEKNRRRLSTWMAKITAWAAIFTLILTGIEGLLFASQSWLKTQINKIESQQNAVLKVEEKQVLVNKLEQVTQNELRPIEMLKAANNIRLKLNLSIEYDRVVIQGKNYITIEGKASSITALNRYVEGLRNSGLFELIDEQKPITRNGKTTFKVSLAYSSEDVPPEEDILLDKEVASTGISSLSKGSVI